MMPQVGIDDMGVRCMSGEGPGRERDGIQKARGGNELFLNQKAPILRPREMAREATTEVPPKSLQAKLKWVFSMCMKLVIVLFFWDHFKVKQVIGHTVVIGTRTPPPRRHKPILQSAFGRYLGHCVN